MWSEITFYSNACVAVKLNVLLNIQQYIFPNEKFEYGYPHSKAFLQFRLELECCKLHKAACHSMNVT